MKKPKMVREPVQVYLDVPHVERLDRLMERLDLTKSDVLRRGLEALERETFDPANDPLMRMIREVQAMPREKPPRPRRGVSGAIDRALAQRAREIERSAAEWYERSQRRKSPRGK